jgi:hypothetical protein
MKKIELLENNVVITHEAVRHSSANQETLNLTESQQYRERGLKKSLAHRKEVMEKKKKAEENQMKVHLPEIEQDRSASKKVSHIRLLALVNKLGEGGLKHLYKKNDLHH